MAYTTPPTFEADTELTAADLNILGDDIVYLKGVVDGLGASAVAVRRTTDQAISTATATEISFGSEVFDFGGWWSSGTDITVPAGAIPDGATSILVGAIGTIKWESNATGKRRIQILVDGVAEASETRNTDDAGVTFQTLPSYFVVEAGQVITLEGHQTSGGNLNINDAKLTIVRLFAAT